MSYPINYPTPQGANVQIFSFNGDANNRWRYSWVKPQGASFVWFTLIGAGGGGSSNSSINGGDGGGSGAVTNCLVPAFLIPDVLGITVGAGGAGTPQGGSAKGNNGGNTFVVYQQKEGTAYTLLKANGGDGAAGAGGGGGPGGLAEVSNYFSCMGFYQSVAGQDGVTGDGTSVTASATTFLSGGAAGPDSVASSGGNVIANYGYVATGGAATNNADPAKGSPFFQLSPIIVGLGGPGGGAINLTATPAAKGGNGGVGCGGGGGGRGNTTYTGAGGDGGDGLVVIISW